MSVRMNKALPSKRFEFLIHLAIWVGYSILIFSGPLISKDFSSQTLMLTLRALVVNSILFYVNTFILLPKLVGKSKYLLYIITIVTLMAGTGLFYEVTEKWFKPPFEERDFPEQFEIKRGDRFIDSPDFKMGERPPFRRNFDKFPRGAHLVFGFISTLGILFISTIFWVISESKRRQEREMALINENLTTEMKFLKSQINPHFLFNALNNVYSLSHTNSSKTPEMILKLSDMLRFMLYESEDKKVFIGKEIDYIKHFIDFQKLKIEGEPRISVNFENAERQVLIEPMLLIPFIENAFKHSKIEDIRHGWVRIELVANHEKINFKVTNSLPASVLHTDKVGGIGLENVRKRLMYLYPHSHKLNIRQANGEFSVDLEITLQPTKK